jgi:hypothetical protein
MGEREYDIFDFDPNAFTFSYPVWICLGVERPNAVLTGRIKPGGNFIYLFTDEHLAEIHIAHSGLIGRVYAAGFPSAEALAGGLRSLRGTGISHVALDVNPRDDLARVMSIAKLIEDLTDDADG